jgi:hypothetical protein
VEANGEFRTILTARIGTDSQIPAPRSTHDLRAENQAGVELTLCLRFFLPLM